MYLEEMGGKTELSSCFLFMYVICLFVIAFFLMVLQAVQISHLIGQGELMKCDIEPKYY